MSPEKVALKLATREMIGGVGGEERPRGRRWRASSPT